MKINRILIIIALGGFLLGAAAATDWPSWRGPGSTGVSPEKDWNPRALENGAKILWKTNVGHGHSAVVVSSGYLYTMGSRSRGTGDKAVYEEAVVCINIETGKEAWRYAYPSRDRDFPGAASTPAVDGDRVYAVGREGEVLCFEARRGTVIWKRNLVQERLCRAPNWGFCSSPVVEGDLLLLNAATSGIALNKMTGRTVWASEPAAGGLATPLLFSRDGKRLAAITSSARMYIVNVATGEVLWNHPWRTDADPLVLAREILLVGGGRNRGSELLEQKLDEPQVLWATENLGGTFQTGVVLDGYAYNMAREGGTMALQCVAVDSGEKKWSHAMDNWGALIAAAGKLIILDGDGDLIISEATPEAYREIGQAKVLSMGNQNQYPRDRPNCCWTAPVLARSRVFARSTYGDLVCVDMR
jgi:outer membrane protein assembly factor BamB